MISNREMDEKTNVQKMHNGGTDKPVSYYKTAA